MDTGMTRSMAGNARVIEELYLEHVGEATRLAYLLTGDTQLSQDLAHDAFVRAAGRLSSLRRPEAFGPYLRRAVVNACTSHHRHARVVRSFMDRQRGVEPVAATIDVEGRDEIVRAIGALPPRQRAAVVLRYWADLSEVEMAEAMGSTIPAVRGLLHRALATIRTELEVQ
jgi:RNA polymerase sigma factor (sigma-70 family)